MNSIKCKNCQLSNFPTDIECRRCGYSFASPKGAQSKSPRQFSVWPLLMIALVAGLVYYFYSGVPETTKAVNANSQPTPGLSRIQADQQRAAYVGNAFVNSASLNAHQKHIDETQKVMQQVSNSGR